MSGALETMLGADWPDGANNTGNDTVIGNILENIIDGGNGNDSLLGLDGNDSLFGGNDNDTLEGGNGNDTLVGGAGSDWATYAVTGAVTVDLGNGSSRGAQGNDSLTGIEAVLSGNGNDWL